MTALRAALITEADDLRALEQPWWDLWRRAPAATPFQSPAWLLPWWSTFAPGDLRAVAVWDGSVLSALAPLYRETGPYGRRLLPIGMSISDYLDALVDPGRGGAAGAALAEVLARPDRDWDRVEWEELPPDSPVLHCPTQAGWQVRATPQGLCPVLAWGEGEGWQTAVPARKLRKLRMAENRAARRGYRLDHAEAGSAFELFDHLVRLHGERWADRGEPGVLANGRVLAFHRLALPGLMAAGLVRLTAVLIAEQVAGVYYGFADRGRAYAYLGGFDPAFAFESPGTLLLGDALECAAREGAREFHFLRGQESYKYEWGAGDRANTRLVLEPAA